VGTYGRFGSYAMTEGGPALFDVLHGPGGPLSLLRFRPEAVPYAFQRVGSWYGHQPVTVGTYTGPSGNTLMLRSPSFAEFTAPPTFDMDLIEERQTVTFTGIPAEAYYLSSRTLLMRHPLNSFGRHVVTRFVANWPLADGTVRSIDYTVPLLMQLGGAGYAVNDDEGLTLGKDPGWLQ
jgi:hypothetical protein